MIYDECMFIDDMLGDTNWFGNNPPSLVANDTDCMKDDMGGTEDEVCLGEGHPELPPDFIEPDMRPQNIIMV